MTSSEDGSKPTQNEQELGSGRQVWQGHRLGEPLPLPNSHAVRVVTQRASGHGLFCWETFRLVCSLFCPCDAVRAAAPLVPCLGQLCRDPFRPLCSRACPCDPASLILLERSFSHMAFSGACNLACCSRSCSCPADGLGLKLSASPCHSDR